MQPLACAVAERVNVHLTGARPSSPRTGKCADALQRIAGRFGRPSRLRPRGSLDGVISHRNEPLTVFCHGTLSSARTRFVTEVQSSGFFGLGRSLSESRNGSCRAIRRPAPSWSLGAAHSRCGDGLLLLRRAGCAQRIRIGVRAATGECVRRVLARWPASALPRRGGRRRDRWAPCRGIAPPVAIERRPDQGSMPLVRLSTR